MRMSSREFVEWVALLHLEHEEEDNDTEQERRKAVTL